MSEPLEADAHYIFRSGKTYTHSIGLSVAFRQWKAESHCRFIHGYSIQVEFTFQSYALDRRNWVVDFGSLKPLKGWLEDLLDHKLLVAEDDPLLPLLKELEVAGGCQIRLVPQTGMEALSYWIFQYTQQWLKDAGYPQVTLENVKVKEHDSNWASYGLIGS